MRAIRRAAPPVSLRMTVRGALDVPTSCVPKEMLVEERLPTAWLRVAEKPTVQGAEKIASAVMTARRNAAFTGAGCSAPACHREAARLRAPRIGGRESV